MLAEDELGERLGEVLEAIYAAYGQGWASTGSDDLTRKGLTEEAIWLAQVLVELPPGDAEALGVLALMLLCVSRSAARRVEGDHVPLAGQDTALWKLPMAREAEDRLRMAGELKRPGRFQLEAAVQSVLLQSRLTGADLRLPTWTLRGFLAQKPPTVGNLVGLAAATAVVHCETEPPFKSCLNCPKLSDDGHFYRAQAGAQNDLVIEIGPRRLVAFEIQSSTAPSPSRGFHSACGDLESIARWIVYPGREGFPLGDAVEAIGLVDAARRIGEL